jgi:hypothetical protein
MSVCKASIKSVLILQMGMFTFSDSLLLIEGMLLSRESSGNAYEDENDKKDDRGVDPDREAIGVCLTVRVQGPLLAECGH